MKTITLAITELALPSPRTGHIQTHSGFGPLPQMGQEIHAIVQAQRLMANPLYQSEKWVTHTFTRGDHRFTVTGRMDGFTPGGPPEIEEIKSVFNPPELLKALEEFPHHPYRLQLLTYAYIQFLHVGVVPLTRLHVVSARTREGVDVPVTLDLDDYRAWLDRRLQEIIDEDVVMTKIHKRRRQLAKDFAFPYPDPRPGQMELMQTVEKNLTGQARLLLQAPTGLGKTAGVLFPSLKEALARGQKVIYLTPKNSQHTVAEDAIRRLRAGGSKVRGLTLHAKGKMCFKEHPVCNPEHCEYARDYYKKVAEQKLVERVLKKKHMSRKAFREIGRKFEVCPFELQLEALPRADVIVCDYNYVFSPRNARTRLLQNGFSVKTLPNLVIDEAHNLPGRAADYFSATLAAKDIEQALFEIDHVPFDVQTLMRSLGADLLAWIRAAGGVQPAEITLEEDDVREFAARAQTLLIRHLESEVEFRPQDPVLTFCHRVAEFQQTHALALESPDFLITFSPSIEGGQIRITCCDAHLWLNEGYGAFANVVAFSATVKPFEYYAQLLGFHGRTHVTEEFTSPFPKNNRKLLIIPQVSTKYSDRAANYGKIREAITKIVAVKPGNYFVFFPSFDFLYRVSQSLEVPGFEMVLQRRDMRREEVQLIVDDLRDNPAPKLILAVQGGVFAEGVDYPGKMLIGALIVGPALPTFDFERELLRARYEQKFGAKNGFDYAYTYPAMARVVQSAGRVIRSSQDRGLIVLMDRRFLQPTYIKSMPTDWVENDARAHVSTQLLKDIHAFWNENHDDPTPP